MISLLQPKKPIIRWLNLIIHFRLESFGACQRLNIDGSFLIDKNVQQLDVPASYKKELQFLCKKPLFPNANSRLRKSSQLSNNWLFINSKGDFSPSFTPSQFMSGFQSPGQSFEIPSGVGFAGGHPSRSGNLTQLSAFYNQGSLQKKVCFYKHKVRVSYFWQFPGRAQLDTWLMELLRLASLLFQKQFTSPGLGPLKGNMSARKALQWLSWHEWVAWRNGIE